MQLTDYVMGLTGLPYETLFMGGMARAVVFDTHDDGTPTIKVWDESVTGKPKPTDEELAVALAAPEAPIPPDLPTLANWRVGLDLWMRDDGTGKKVARLADVQAAVQALLASANPAKAGLGKVAFQQLEYSNVVERARLMALHDAFGFTVNEVDESLWRADRIAQGDFSGQWPVAA